MPGLDGTGPQGQGSRTGRGLGRCTPEQADKLIGLMRGIGRGIGRGLGRGRGRGRGLMDGTGPRRGR